MKLQTLLRDALFVNWALPCDKLPELPAPLRYQRHREGKDDRVLASVLLSRQMGLQFSLPFFRLSYPQLHLRFSVFDAQGDPAFYVASLLVPAWVAPATAMLARQRSMGARFRFPATARLRSDERWRWSVRNGSAFEVEGRFGAPTATDLGGWDDTVAYVMERPRSYIPVGHRLRRIDSEPVQIEPRPITAEILDLSLLVALEEAFDGTPVHSAWLCPSLPMVFELGAVPTPKLRTALPQTAPSSRSRLSSQGG
ncbi:MAG: DUF2071 domain-containing protein [Acidobacteriota bacterium]